MKIKLKEIPRKNIKWEDLEYGDVFKYDYSGCRDEIRIALGIKVYDNDNGDSILDLENFFLCSDINNYNIVEVLDCTLVEGYNED